MLAFSYVGHALPGSIAIGRFRLPVYGVFATAGLVAALMVGEKTAERAGVDRDKLWDAGVTAVIVAFFASRILLVVSNFAVFKAMPLLVLTLPSLTYGGVLATGICTAVYLRVKRVPLLAAMDAWAPCAAVLAAFLQVGHFFEGTDAGLPTKLPWGVLTPGDTVMGRVQPVQLYGAVAALVLALWLYRDLTRVEHPWWWRRQNTGTIAACGLFFGGIAAFVLDMLRQPIDSQSTWPLEPSQFLALGGMVAGTLLFFLKPKLSAGRILSRGAAADLLNQFVLEQGSASDYYWDEFVGAGKFEDPLVDRIRRECLSMQKRWTAATPTDQPPAMPSEGEFAKISEYAQELCGSGEQPAAEKRI